MLSVDVCATAQDQVGLDPGLCRGTDMKLIAGRVPVEVRRELDR
jgi:hypothetical protein